MTSKINLSSFVHSFRRKNTIPEAIVRLPGELKLSNNQEREEEPSISKKLSQLPKIKAKQGFDQRMAAAFAMELEKETQRLNSSRLQKNGEISLPDIFLNLS